MDFGRDQDENTAGVVEAEPCEQQRGKYADDATNAVEGAAARGRWGQAAQASRTDEAVFMLDDALAAIVITAIRTAANRFPVRMMQATLVSECRDGVVLTAKRLRAGGGVRIADGE